MQFAKDLDKGFLDHIEDLRKVILKSAIAIAVAMGISFCYIKEIFAWIQEPLRQALILSGKNPDSTTHFLKTLNVTDPLSLMIEIGLSTGLVLACPFVLYFIGSYVLPALNPREKRYVTPAFIAGGLLFLGGATFCYYIILPQTLQFFLDFNDWFGWSADWPIDRYIDFVLQMLIAFGVSFELPLLVIILALIGIIDYAFLKYYRRHMIVFLVIFAACVTPTSDPFNLFMLFGPMYMLYEISVFIVRFIDKKNIEIVDVHDSKME